MTGIVTGDQQSMSQQPTMENQQPIMERNQISQPTSTESYIHSAPASPRPQMADYTPQPSQPEAKPAEGKNNPTLSRALIGGLVGATLGTLAGALASEKTSAGFNHAVKGIGNAFRTIGAGLNQAGKGVGDAAKSVGEGVSYAVVGGTVDTAKGVVEGAKQIGVATADAVQNTAGMVNEVVQNTADSVKTVSEMTAQSVASTAETSKGMASDAGESLKRDFNEMESEAAQIRDEDNPFPEFVGEPSSTL